jgi:hypothetical protein
MAVLQVLTFILVLVVALSISWRSHGETQRDFPTTKFYTKDGRLAGSSTTYSGGITKFYNANGEHVGTTVRSKK